MANLQPFSWSTFVTLYASISSSHCSCLTSPIQPNAFVGNLITRVPTAHSRIGHYFYSNPYGCAPWGARGVKRTGRAQGLIPTCVFALIFSLDWTNFEKPHKIKKIYPKMTVLWRFFKVCSIWAKYYLTQKHIKVVTLVTFQFFWHHWHS